MSIHTVFLGNAREHFSDRSTYFAKVKGRLRYSLFHILLSRFIVQPINLQDSPDENTLAVVSLPQAAVALVGHSEDMRRQLPHVMFAVQVDSSAIVQACYLLIGIYCCQN